MKKVLDFVQRFDLLPRYELLLAAASGGLDSMCLLDFLYENGYRVCAAHYNHQLRGQEADMDEDLVRAWCAARRIPLCVGTGDVAAYAGENGLTIEEAARKLRYDFLNSVAGQTGAARIVTAHHANDNAETVLFHLARGTGMAGLAGIAPKNGRLVRPFLCLTREELAAYAKEHHVPYRTDATNADTALTRNFIRADSNLPDNLGFEKAPLLTRIYVIFLLKSFISPVILLFDDNDIWVAPSPKSRTFPTT